MFLSIQESSSSSAAAAETLRRLSSSTNRPLAAAAADRSPQSTLNEPLLQNALQPIAYDSIGGFMSRRTSAPNRAGSSARTPLLLDHPNVPDEPQRDHFLIRAFRRVSGFFGGLGGDSQRPSKN